MVPKTRPIETIKPAITFNSTWPATILANNRTERVIGLIKKEISSKTKIRGAIKTGTPLGKNICKKPEKPFLMMA